MDRNCLERRKRKLPAFLNLTHGKRVEAYGESLQEPIEGVHLDDYASGLGPVARDAGKAAPGVD